MLLKIDKLRDITKRTKPCTTALDPEIYIRNYEICCFHRNWHSRGVACYTGSYISFKLNSLWQMILKISHSLFWWHTQNQLQLELYSDPQISLDFLV